MYGKIWLEFKRNILWFRSDNFVAIDNLRIDGKAFEYMSNDLHLPRVSLNVKNGIVEVNQIMRETLYPALPF